MERRRRSPDEEEKEPIQPGSDPQQDESTSKESADDDDRASSSRHDTSTSSTSTVQSLRAKVKSAQKAVLERIRKLAPNVKRFRRGSGHSRRYDEMVWAWDRSAPEEEVKLLCSDQTYSDKQEAGTLTRRRTNVAAIASTRLAERHFPLGRGIFLAMKRRTTDYLPQFGPMSLPPPCGDCGCLEPTTNYEKVISPPEEFPDLSPEDRLRDINLTSKLIHKLQRHMNQQLKILRVERFRDSAKLLSDSATAQQGKIQDPQSPIQQDIQQSTSHEAFKVYEPNESVIESSEQRLSVSPTPGARKRRLPPIPFRPECDIDYTTRPAGGARPKIPKLPIKDNGNSSNLPGRRISTRHRPTPLQERTNMRQNNASMTSHEEPNFPSRPHTQPRSQTAGDIAEKSVFLRGKRNQRPSSYPSGEALEEVESPFKELASAIEFYSHAVNYGIPILTPAECYGIITDCPRDLRMKIPGKRRRRHSSALERRSVLPKCKQPTESKYLPFKSAPVGNLRRRNPRDLEYLLTVTRPFRELEIEGKKERNMTV